MALPLTANETVPMAVTSDGEVDPLTRNTVLNGSKGVTRPAVSDAAPTAVGSAPETQPDSSNDATSARDQALFISRLLETSDDGVALSSARPAVFFGGLDDSGAATRSA